MSRLESEPTLLDVMNTLNTNHASTEKKLESIKTAIETRMDSIESDFNQIKKDNDTNNQRLQACEIVLEQLKQERIRNNIRISGFHKECHPIEFVSKLGSILNVNFNEHEYEAYFTKNSTFIIVSFHNFMHKMMLLRKMRARRNLMLEEMYPNIKSNSQVYLNDHLTPYLTNIFHKAWEAKKDSSVHAASTVGGKVRVRKTCTSSWKLIWTLEQLYQIINNNVINNDTNDNPDIIEVQSTSGSSSSSATANTVNNKNKPNKNSPKNQSHNHNQKDGSKSKHKRHRSTQENLENKRKEAKT